MSVYSIGTANDNVTLIQQKLIDSGYLNDRADGIFGKNTAEAVKKFQSANGLAADGIVGPNTWQRLFSHSETGNSKVTGDLNSRCLALTGSFETGCLAPLCFGTVTGNFDGQGISYGALQWNFGQGTLQPLLLKMFAEHREIADSIFKEKFSVLQDAISGDKEKAIRFAESIQDSTGKRVTPEWKAMFTDLGKTSEFQKIEVDGAQSYIKRAEALWSEYDLKSSRGKALMFDICVQNGSIPSKVKAVIEKDFKSIPALLTPSETEVEKMRIIANRRAEAANPRFIEDVRRRKLCIAEGRGTVHGITYNIQDQFGLGLDPIV